MRNFAKRGANVFIVLSNDAWYPRSSEPEQHLANAVIRCVESGLPMIRCGNNGGSGMVTAWGEFTGYIGSSAPRPELLRERTCGVVEVPVYRTGQISAPFVKYGEWFILLLAIFAFAVIIYGVIWETDRLKQAGKLIGENS